MKKAIFFLLALAAMTLTIGGCSTSTDPADNTSSLENFGSYRATDEPSADFGDPALAEMLTDQTEEPYNDPVALSPVVDSLENNLRPDLFCFRMVWGNLARDSNINELTDWSGTLTLSRGAIIITRLMGFEPGQDSLIVRPYASVRGGLNEIAWVSHTSTRIDGIATRLIIPQSPTDEIVTITYESKQLSITFPMDRFDDLDTLISIGPGNAISFHSVRCERRPAIPTHGYLMGRWGRDENGNGIFYGRWMNVTGQIMGAVKGDWGIDSTGQRVFVGKYVDISGRFEGFVRGTWRDLPMVSSTDCCPIGRFWGRIFDADRQPVGVVKGHYMRADNRRSGYFSGLWCTGGDCFMLRQ
jgi:hypothetical protein